jgi:site-specific DNA recombinase
VTTDTRDRICAVIYARFSPRRDAAETLSCEKQRTICEEYCTRMKYVVTHYFEDRATSGDDGDRPGLWRAVEAVRRGGRLVVRWRHRLAREVYLYETIRRSIDGKGAAIEAVEDGHNTQSPQDRLVQQILMAMAEHERRMIGLRTKWAMRRYQKEGRMMGSIPPYGYMEDPLVPRRLVPNEEEQKVLQVIMDMHSRGWAAYRIAAELDTQGYLPRYAYRWDHSTISRILQRAKD